MRSDEVFRTAAWLSGPCLVGTLALVSYPAAVVVAAAAAALLAARTLDWPRSRSRAFRTVSISPQVSAGARLSTHINVDLFPTQALPRPASRAECAPARSAPSLRPLSFILAGIGLGLAAGAAILILRSDPVRPEPEPRLLPPVGLPIHAFSPLQYRMTLQRIPRRGFNVTERMLIRTRRGPDTLRFVSRMVRSTSLGLLRKKVTVDLRCNAPLASEIFQNPSILSVAARRFGANCPDTVNVELTEMPVDMFYQARGVGSVEKTAFLDNESIRWTQVHPEKTIDFAYLAPPAHILRPFVPDHLWVHPGGRLLIFAVLGIMSLVTAILIALAAELLKTGFQKRGRV